jgi:hypothetical protein
MRTGGSRRLVMRPRTRSRPALLGLGALGMLVALSVPPASSRQSIGVVGPFTALQGIDCISRSDCWAVGLVVNKAGARLNQAV